MLEVCVRSMQHVTSCVRSMCEGRASHDCILRHLLYRRFPPTFTNAKTTAILWRGCKFAGKNSYFPLPLDVRRCVAPTGEEVDARQRGVN